jgi:hypothetical protein
LLYNVIFPPSFLPSFHLGAIGKDVEDVKKNASAVKHSDKGETDVKTSTKSNLGQSTGEDALERVGLQLWLRPNN